jgi:hypothetical protein
MPEIEQQTLLQLIHVFELHGLRQWHESIFHELMELASPEILANWTTEVDYSDYYKEV